MTKTKKLYRSKKDRMIGGVCGGIGEHLKADSTLIRLLWVIGTILFLGAGLFAYLVAWIIIPEKR
jgi:phage shock protein PspC (stress-responsive transcriptional regulator)